MLDSRNIDILEHICGYCKEINHTMDTLGRSYEVFSSHSIYQNAVALCVLQIGELTTHFTDEFKETYSKIPWNQIKALRNVVAHNYGKIDKEILWETLINDIPGLDSYCHQIIMENKDKMPKFTFREIQLSETEQAITIEQICFPPHEACSAKAMTERIGAAAELFLVAVDQNTGKIAGFLNGVATDETAFRDGFFTNSSLHNASGKNVMLLGLDVLPEYRGQGLAKEIVNRYVEKERARDREYLILTCLAEKVKMYQRMGFTDCGIANSTWGNEEWHEMRYALACKVC